MELRDVEYAAGQHGLWYQTAFSPSGQEVLLIRGHYEQVAMFYLDLIERGGFENFSALPAGETIVIWRHRQ